MTNQPIYPDIVAHEPKTRLATEETLKLNIKERLVNTSLPERQTDPLDVETPRRLKFIVKETNDIFEVGVRLYMVVGRKTSPRDKQVDVDLTAFVKPMHGVSRYHAYIQVVDDRISISDFNSTNGTYINGNILQASQSYRLRHGDNVRFGRLEMKVLFIGINNVD